MIPLPADITLREILRAAATVIRENTTDDSVRDERVSFVINELNLLAEREGKPPDALAAMLIGYAMNKLEKTLLDAVLAPREEN